ncbi:hypothetical protein [Paenibacillus sp. MBLB4367]|uniref:hypothetical protein n=1 Tax=Paenibacillus sp. MBLB4367 TaxID=3384767 RepID=UPI0039081D7F
MTGRQITLCSLAAAGVLLVAFAFYADRANHPIRPDAEKETALQRQETAKNKPNAAPIAKEAKTGAALYASEEQGGMYENLILQVNGGSLHTTWSNEINPSFAPEIYALDLNKDGRDELLILITTGHGTGVRESWAHAIDPEKLAEIAVDNPVEAVRKHIQSKVTTAEVSVSVGPGGTPMRIDPETIAAEPANWFDKLAFGSIVRFEIRNNELVAEIPAQLSPADFIGEATLTYDYRNGRYSPYRIEFTSGNASTMLLLD